MELSPDQIIIVGMVASVVTQALRLIAERWFVPAKWVVSLALLVISFGLAYAFFGFDIPGGVEDPVGFIFEKTLALAGSAVILYNLLLDKVLMPPGSKLAAKIKFK